MPTQRTHRIEMNSTERYLIMTAVEGMKKANDSLDHCGHNDAYGGFYTALQNLMRNLCFGDPDFMELWESQRIQGSLDINDWTGYPEQIKFVLESEGIEVIFT